MTEIGLTYEVTCINYVTNAKIGQIVFPFKMGRTRDLSLSQTFLAVLATIAYTVFESTWSWKVYGP